MEIFIVIGVICAHMVDFHRSSHILSSPVDRSTVEDGNNVTSATHGLAFIRVINCSPAT